MRLPAAGHPARARLVPPALSSSVLVALLLAALPAEAHVGAVVAKAEFCAPGPIVEVPDGNGGTRYVYAPDEADTRYRISWSDGDNDPTGKFTLYYLDHMLPTSVYADALEPANGQPGIGKIVVTVGRGAARDVWVSCACGFEDAGGACDGGSALYRCADGGARWCDNFVDWDTSNVPDGVYWIAAVNNDPPYHVYNMSPTPVRVSHTPARPPIIVITRPNGLGLGGNTTVHVEAVIVGTPPLHVDLAWGINEASQVNDPLRSIAKGLPVTQNADNAFTYEWDVAALKPEVYLLGATVTDSNGKSTFSETRDPISVSHPPDAAVPVDFSLSPTPHDARGFDGFGDDHPGSSARPACACALASRRTRGAGATWLLPLGAIGLGVSRRLRRGSRSACTC